MKLGEKQILYVVKRVEFGVYLAEHHNDTEERVLLPAKQVPPDTGIGDQLEVFLYKDSKDRMIATTNTPRLVMGQVAELTVAQTGKIGAFLDWGLEKDLLLPFRQQDNQYSALIPKKELYGQVTLGEDLRARVSKVQPDGRLVLSIREKGYLQIQEDAERLLEILDSYEGVLPFNDKVSPAIILRETGMSKNEFKRAVGNLLKAGKIQITEKVIRRI